MELGETSVALGTATAQIFVASLSVLVHRPLSTKSVPVQRAVAGTPAGKGE